MKHSHKQAMHWLSFLAVLVVIVGGLIYLGQPASEEEIASEVSAVVEQDNVKGSKDAPITLIEYSDFQCPACASVAPFLSQLNEEMPDKVQIVYRHFPLRQIHPFAQLAAQASEAAADQDKFWEYHDKLFENQNQWATASVPEEVFTKYAEELELDIDKFKEDLKGKSAKNKVNGIYLEAGRIGINSTPTLFLNGKKISNPANYASLKALVELAQ